MLVVIDATSALVVRGFEAMLGQDLVNPTLNELGIVRTECLRLDDPSHTRERPQEVAAIRTRCP